MKQKTAPATPPVDEFAGQGGSYVIDLSGRRQRVAPDVDPAADPTPPEVQTSAPPQPTPSEE